MYMFVNDFRKMNEMRDINNINILYFIKILFHEYGIIQVTLYQIFQLASLLCLSTGSTYSVSKNKQKDICFYL